MSQLLDLARAAELLRAGGVVVYPTETFYALGALASREDALLRLAEGKLRPEGKPLPLLAADLGQVREVASISRPLALALAAHFWPGPLSLVLPALPGLSAAVTAGTGTVAVRVPGSTLARELARLSGGPLVSTSANLSGGPPPCRVEELDGALLARVDGVLDGGPTPGGKPSTLVALGGGVPRLLREGAVPFDEVLEVARLFFERGG